MAPTKMLIIFMFILCSICVISSISISESVIKPSFVPNDRAVVIQPNAEIGSAEKNYSLALDDDVHIHKRIIAAKLLTGEHKKKYMNAIMDKLRGNADVNMYHAIWILEEVGDTNFLDQLKKLSNQHMPGKINVAIKGAISKILQRESAAAKLSE